VPADALPIKLPINYSALPITRRYDLEMIVLLTSTNVTKRHWTDGPKAIPKPCVAGSSPAGGAERAGRRTLGCVLPGSPESGATRSSASTRIPWTSAGRGVLFLHIGAWGVWGTGHRRFDAHLAGCAPSSSCADRTSCHRELCWVRRRSVTERRAERSLSG